MTAGAGSGGAMTPILDLAYVRARMDIDRRLEASDLVFRPLFPISGDWLEQMQAARANASNNRLA